MFVESWKAVFLNNALNKETMQNQPLSMKRFAMYLFDVKLKP